MPYKHLILKTVWGRGNKHLSVGKILLIIMSVLLLPGYQPYIVDKQRTRLPVWHLSEKHRNLNSDLKGKKKVRKSVYLMLMHWWILQKVSKMKRRAFSMKSSRQATRKKSFTKTCKNDSIFDQVRQKSKHFFAKSTVIGSSKVKCRQRTDSNRWLHMQLDIFKVIHF